MRVYDIALKNLNRRKGRMLFLALALAIAIGTVVTMFSLAKALQDSVGAQLDQFGANIIVLPRSESLSVSYGGFNLSGISYDLRALSAQDIERIRSIPYRNRLSVVAPKLLKPFMVAGDEYVVAGVDFPSELRLKQWWEIEGSKPQHPNDVLVGFAAATKLGLVRSGADSPGASDPHSHDPRTKPGLDFLQRSLDIGGKTYQVVGVIHQTGTQEDGFIFADLASIQQISGSPDQITLIEISALCNNCPIEDIVAQLTAAVPHGRVSAVQQAVKARLQTVEKLVKFSYVLSGIVIAIAFLVVCVSTMSSILERTRELGILRAVGFRSSHVLKMLFTEVVVISLIGGFLGCLTGSAAAFLASPYFVDPTVHVKPGIQLLASSLTLAVVVGLLASLYPASRAARLDPVEALRFI